MTAALIALTLLVPITADNPDALDRALYNNTGATATQPAVRLNPPVVVAVGEPPLPPFAPEGLDDCDDARFYRQQVGLPAVFDYITYRESRCINRDDVRTWCCYSRYQLYVSLHLRDSSIAPGYHACGVWSALDINSDTPDDKRRAACATKALYDVKGLAPWN